ncbi:MAG: YraN family protein [Actinomycetales bacterium]
MKAKDALGKAGEDLAARYLVAHGMQILDRNWRCRLGEIDLVARDGETIVICEVKTRSGAGYDGPLAAITPLRLQRLERLAHLWLDAHQMRQSWVRLDGIGIVQGSLSGPQIQHVQGLC